MSIQIGANVYSSHRIRRILDSETEALKLRGWDRFKEWTGLGDKGQPKKIQLKELYNQLQSETLKDNKSNEVNNDNINRLIIFNKMSKLVNESSNGTNNSQVNFSVLIDSPNGLSSNIIYKVGNHNLLTKQCNLAEKMIITKLKDQSDIDHEGVLMGSLSSEKIKQQQQQMAATKIQQFYMSKSNKHILNNTKKVNEIVLTINSKLPKDQHIEDIEVYSAIHRCKFSKDFPIHISSSDSKKKHSILIYKNKDNYCILIKPNIKNNNKKHENLKSGSYKKVKTSGVEINLDKNKNLISTNRVVTLSQSSDGDKNKKLQEVLGRDLLNEQFLPVLYKDNKNGERIIYIKKYLGDDIENLLYLKKISIDDKKLIIKQLISKFNNQIGDIKLQNIVWDGKTATFIDSNDLIFTYTSKSDRLRDDNRGVYTDEEDKSSIQHQQIFSLCMVCYLLCESELTHVKGSAFSDDKPNKLNLNNNNIFSNLVHKAYNEKLLLDELKQFVKINRLS